MSTKIGFLHFQEAILHPAVSTEQVFSIAGNIVTRSVQVSSQRNVDMLIFF